MIEAQYQDAVRLEVANLYEAYLGALLARESIRFSGAAVTGLDRVLETIRDRKEEKIATRADVDSVRIQRELAAASLFDAEQTYRSTKVRLGALLGIPAPQAERIELRGSLKVEAPTPPLGGELVSLALSCRPDLQAYRLGVRRSQADVKLALANRFADVYVLYQPYTFQDNSPFGARSATSWAAGVTVPLPLYNRNQGNIPRPGQRRPVEGRAGRAGAPGRRRGGPGREGISDRAGERRTDGAGHPARGRPRPAHRLCPLRAGERDILFYLYALRDYNDFVRQYLTDWLRFRRSMLRLNTVVGQRLLP